MPELAHAEIPLSLVLENTIVGIGALRRRRFVWANARMGEIFGYAPEELIGESVRRFYVTEADYDAVDEAYERSARRSFYTHEHQQVRRNGEIIWCRMSGRILDSGGPDTLSIWVVQDLTDKKRAEDQLRRINHQLEQTVLRRTLNLHRSNEALRAEIERRRKAQLVSTESRDKYRALFGTLPLGVLVTNADGEVSEFNRALQAMLGVVTRAALGGAICERRVVLPDGRRTSLAQLVRDQRVEGRPHRFEFHWVAGDGAQRDVAAVAVPLATRALGAVFTFSDITEQRRSRERELLQRDEFARASRLSLMGQMMSALAHELGQPLNACQSYLIGIRHRLAEEQSDTTPISAALDKAIAHVVQAGEIIRNVRSFVARQEPEFRAVPLPDLITQTLRLLEVSARNAGIKIRFECAPEARARPALCNAVQIQQVLVNLLLNAFEALQISHAADRLVEIAVGSGTRDKLTVRVSDNGPGVPAKLAARLFEPYVTTKPDGLGMGLMISRTIVENHNGKLKLVCSRAGRTSFVFTLRAAQLQP